MTATPIGYPDPYNKATPLVVDYSVSGAHLEPDATAAGDTQDADDA